MKQSVKNRLLNVALTKIKFYPNLDNEFGGCLQFQEMIVLAEQGIEIINKDMFDYYIKKPKDGINGGGWIYFKEGRVQGKVKERLMNIKWGK